MNNKKESLINSIINNQSINNYKNRINQIHPADIAHILEALPSEERKKVWKILEVKSKGEILLNVRDEVKIQLIKISSITDLFNAVVHLQLDEIVDLNKLLPEEVSKKIIDSMDADTRRRYEQLVLYPHDTAGGLMDIDAISLHSDISIKVALRYLRLIRKKQSIPEHLDSVFVVDKNKKYIGTVEIQDLISLPLETSISEIVNCKFSPLNVSTSSKNVAKIFKDYDLNSAPVVDDSNVLLGRITIDDVVDVITEEDEKLIMRPAGLSEKTDIFSTVLESLRYRSVWHGINLINALIASYTISFFTQSIEKIVSLAVLMPIIATMGGVAGNQTLTLVTRGIALDQISNKNKFTLISKETCIALLNGAIWSTILALITYIWLHNFWLSAVFSTSLMISLLFSTIAGVFIPLILTNIKIDPALAGSVLLVIITDVGGFFIFLGLATMILAR